MGERRRVKQGRRGREQKEIDRVRFVRKWEDMKGNGTKEKQEELQKNETVHSYTYIVSVTGEHY